MNVAAADSVVCRNLVKSFPGGARVLDDLSLAIRRGEFFTLLGPSGCGKTTLLRAIAGFERQDGGTISVQGETLDGLPPHRRPVNTVFQSYAVFPHMSVAGNIAFGLEMQRMRRAEIDRRVAEMISLVRLDGLERRRPAQLSGGQQQRVALARALAARPLVLLLDEPLSALDLKLRGEMQTELKRLQRETGITFVFVTHDQGEALTLSDRMAVMSGGRIAQVGTPQEIYERPASRFVADFIGEANLLEAERIGDARVRLPCGAHLAVAAAGEAGGSKTVTLVIRPERIALAAPGGEAALQGTVEQVVYLGTDTTYHVRLDGGAALRVRAQNRIGAAPLAQPGEIVAVDVPAAAVHVLEGP
jgi:spermidine/putrescine transport system ATP-binding protein